MQPLIARQLSLSHDDALGEVRLLIRGFYRRGYLHLLNVHFPAVTGESLDVMATAFVPDVDEEEGWSDLPPFIGLGGCLARMRFAIDPGSDTFYFGPLS